MSLFLETQLEDPGQKPGKSESMYMIDPTDHPIHPNEPKGMKAILKE